MLKISTSLDPAVILRTTNQRRYDEIKDFQTVEEISTDADFSETNVINILDHLKTREPVTDRDDVEALLKSFG